MKRQILRDPPPPLKTDQRKARKQKAFLLLIEYITDSIKN